MEALTFIPKLIVGLVLVWSIVARKSQKSLCITSKSAEPHELYMSKYYVSVLMNFALCNTVSLLVVEIYLIKLIMCSRSLVNEIASFLPA